MSAEEWTAPELSCGMTQSHDEHLWRTLSHQWTCPGVLSIDTTHLFRQRQWSENTFGPGVRRGVVDHIRKELIEVEESDLLDLEEWVDVVILALDGAWRCGATPAQIIAAIKAKQTKNEGRTWPDWREVGTDSAIEHIGESS